MEKGWLLLPFELVWLAMKIIKIVYVKIDDVMTMRALNIPQRSLGLKVLLFFFWIRH